VTLVAQRLVVICAVIGRAIFGFIRGPHYTPILVVAIVEEAYLFGVPAFVVGLFLAAFWLPAATIRRNFR
jgi:hypothetical protein